MPDLQHAYLARARAALDLAAEGASTSQEAQAKAFAQVVRTMLLAGTPQAAANHLARHANPAIQKAAAEGLTGDWGPDFEAMAAAYVESIAEGSALDQIARYARVIPDRVSNVMLAAGFTAGTVNEAGPKVTRTLGLDAVEVEPLKAAAIVAITQELARAAGDAGFRLFEDELRRAVQRGTNQAVLAAINSGTTISIPSTGDALSDLRAGLRSAPPSAGFVVLASTGDVADLATRVENRRAGVRGGSFVPGVELVAVDDADVMTIIPASLLAIRDWGLRITSSGHASIDMRQSATAPYELTSLFQADSLGILGERLFSIATGDAASVIVGGS